ncbi:hypothetical protein CHS0354_008117 [Potamilus streckersoni]|uniref:Uncharacterized protein n=1 Tax=Potamilus streckersoni TaxID=2493646 RepID=A0AAE0T013_9BIVA|nr:hypothetical protein CHS0354_008117 [Potamilus streckersoni]
MSIDTISRSLTMDRVNYITQIAVGVDQDCSSSLEYNPLSKSNYECHSEMNRKRSISSTEIAQF